LRIFGFEIKKATPTAVFRSQLRPSNGQGPYTRYFRNWVPRKVETDFYEVLREAIPIIDAAIWRLVSLDGHIVVKGNNEAMVDEIRDWMEDVKVNDMQKGLQSFHQNITNEAFEQGFGLGEFITDSKRTNIIQLRVADSKTIKFARKNSSIEIYQKADGDLDWRLLKPDNLLYFSVNNENQNPYGTSIMRSMEFVSKILVTMHNSLLNVWERFGDPSFQITYKAGKRTLGADTLEQRRQKIAEEFDTSVRKKREGQSMDFVSVIDKDSDFEIKVIGAEGQVLEMEVPARHVLEQIVSKTGLPPWMLGLHWSTTERMADKEVTMLLQDVTTRQAAKLPFFERLISTQLLLMGRTWKRGDWWIEFETANLHDIEKQARARFLNAQADMYYLNAGIPIDEIPKKSQRAEVSKKGQKSHGGSESCGCQKVHHEGCKELRRPFDWPDLDKAEHDYENELKYDWSELRDKVFMILGFDTEVDLGKQEIPAEEAFRYTEEQRAAIMKALRDWVDEYDPAKFEDSAVKFYYDLAYSLGLIQAAIMVGAERPILDIIRNSEILKELYATGFELVKNRATLHIVNKILPELDAMVIVGTNPKIVAQRLKQLFGNANSDWERLARSELAMAAEKAKLDEWKEWKVRMVEFTPAPDACPICMALEGDYEIENVPVPVEDTHPRCRCSTRPSESEVEG